MENSQRTILVVDDDVMYRMLLTKYLTQWGFHVLQEDSGEWVSEIIRRESPVACIIDLVMDGKEGMETIIETRKYPILTRLIAISSQDIYLEAAVLIGADAGLRKPFTQQQLRDTLHSVGIST